MSQISDARNSFEATFASHQRQLYRYIAVLLPARDAADEVFQQTCYALLKSRDRFDSSCEFLPWARGVARNVVREYLRARRRLPFELSDELIEQLAATQTTLAPEIDRRLGALSLCLERLSREKRALVERCYSGAENIRTVAEMLKIQPLVLYKRLDRIRWTLLRCIERTVAGEERL
jgi:RNA polymerase sigma-70 factor, ECF subfamily